MLSRIRVKIGIAVIGYTFATQALAQAKVYNGPIYLNPNAAVEARIADLVPRLTPAEKVDLLSGNEMETHGNARLGIPKIEMADGALGVRWNRATAFPAGIAMGASFDRELVAAVAQSIAEEARALGRNMILGPNVNISRLPISGRAFESFGEDPFLTASLAASYVSSMQAQHVITSTKHFALNDEEYNRMKINVVADERTMNEIYFPPFVSSIAAGTWTIMAAYNSVNGHFCSENDPLLHGVLEQTWGFKGFVISDWGATHSTIAAANAGLDVEMPHPNYFTVEAILDAISANQIAQATIDEKVSRLLRVEFGSGLFDQADFAIPPGTEVNSTKHQATELQAAQESIVLLKNESALLPLSPKVKSIAVLGPAAQERLTGGGGSSHVEAVYAVNPFEGLQNRLNQSVEINYAQGVPYPGDDFESGDNDGDFQDAIDAALNSDVAILFVGLNDRLESEGYDRFNMDLPDGQDALISAIADVNPNTIVVIESGTPVTMTPWISKVKAVVQAWYLGDETGNAIADILLGNINPSGKLPVTFPKQLSDVLAYQGYPGKQGNLNYAEGIFVGYRHFDTHQVEPLFPFGFGLSYTSFSYSNIHVDVRSAPTNSPVVNLSFDITNTGDRAGTEIAQVYVAPPSNTSITRAAQELKGFERVELAPGETKTMHMQLDQKAFQYYDETMHTWKLLPGTYQLRVSASSRDIRLSSQVEL